ncbi:MAG: replication-associated recombination protein A [Opitutales bacterium]|nr:replication-associated recombination protein A [Opitutales bacterium]
MEQNAELDFFQKNSDTECKKSSERVAMSAPLAVRMRPKSLEDVVGHSHILGEGCLLPRLVSTNNFGSLIFYGPPGCGKTTLAEVIACQTGSRFVKLNAVLSNVAQVRDELSMARYRKSERTIVFIDEIHRFNKAQQDLLLPDVEDGNIRLIGATTQNPGFYVNAPLLSRSHLFKLEPLSSNDIAKVLRRALTDTKKGLGNFNCKADDSILLGIAKICDGDMRRALNALETMVLAAGGNSSLTDDDLKVFAKERRVRYDSDEDEHYNTISAFIKSVRGCDPDAAMYWLAKMLAGGEDPRFIARRLVILASEDVGLADSRGLLIANATFDAVERVGLPECELNLAHATIFLATAPKSNSATMALFKAKELVANEEIRPVPMHLRDAHNAFNKKLGNGADYIYNHDCPNHISGQDYMEKPVDIYTPTYYGGEKQILERLQFYKQLKEDIKNGRK